MPKAPPVRRSHGAHNVMRKIMSREHSAATNTYFKRHHAADKFRNAGLKNSFSIYDSSVSSAFKLAFLRKPSKISEITSAKDVLFGLTQSGVCVAFDLITKKRICYLNVTPDEVIRSLFYNKTNNSIITVSVYRHDNFSSLNCRTTPIEYIKRGKPEAGFPLFESETLRWPGFVEFDDVNGKILTFSAENKVYKIWDMRNYNLLYSIGHKNLQEIKISPGVMLLIYERVNNHITLEIVSIDTGKTLHSFKHELKKGKKVDFIEQFNEHLLVKQENEGLQIMDVRTQEVAEVARSDFATPSAFIFLYENQLFLTFRSRCIAVWNFRGELVSRFEDHLLWYPDCTTNNIYISSSQDLILSYCKHNNYHRGSINVSSILTGKCMAKICCDDSWDESSKAALEEVSALFYNEERNEIYTGNKNGTLHVWTN